MTDSGDWKKVEEAWNSGEIETVYNLTVADWHTYFVGDEGWGWAAWAHNNCEPVYIRNKDDAQKEISTNTALEQLLNKARLFRKNNLNFERNYAVAVGKKNGVIVFAEGYSKGKLNHSERFIWDAIQTWDSVLGYFSERVPCDKCRNPLGGTNAQNYYYKTMLWAQKHESFFKLFCVTNAASDNDPQAAINISNFYSSFPPI